ncbi:MAG: GNAT family N-acetyltransferase [Anaeromyxobacter sp.]|nr:GNAT family N-acetyltransferase [Anaeromyxobacter sp.]MBL0278204.1 GNAT family N-acetyltransferase [Anaeromyxobacter sp.]
MRAATRAEAAAYPAGLAEAWGALPALYHRWAVTAGGETRVLAEVAGRVVAFAGWRGREVTALFVHPRARGLGLGARLLRRAEVGAARAAPGRALVVIAALGAAPFYLARGWRDAGPAASPLPGGRSLPARRLRTGPARPASRPARRARRAAPTSP